MHYKAQRTVDRLSQLIERAISEGYDLDYIADLTIARNEVIELGYELDEADFDTWLANHKGLLDEDYLGNDENDDETES